MNGTLCCVGVGPGDPELLTIKAVKIIQATDCIACPAHMDKPGDFARDPLGASIADEEGPVANDSSDNTTPGNPGIAYHIAAQAVPEIVSKKLLLLDFPMKSEKLEEAHNIAAGQIISVLEEGKNVAFLTLGDPGFYSSFSYIFEEIMRKGFSVNIVSGIPSFCAASAEILCPLATGRETVTISAGEYREADGTLVILKAGKQLKQIKQRIAASGKTAFLIENCGMEGEKIYSGTDAMPDETGYFSLMIVKS